MHLQIVEVCLKLVAVLFGTLDCSRLTVRMRGFRRIALRGEASVSRSRKLQQFPILGLFPRELRPEVLIKHELKGGSQARFVDDLALAPNVKLQVYSVKNALRAFQRWHLVAPLRKLRLARPVIRRLIHVCSGLTRQCGRDHR